MRLQSTRVVHLLVIRIREALFEVCVAALLYSRLDIVYRILHYRRASDRATTAGSSTQTFLSHTLSASGAPFLLCCHRDRDRQAVSSA